MTFYGSRRSNAILMLLTQQSRFDGRTHILSVYWPSERISNALLPTACKALERIRVGLHLFLDEKMP